MTKTVDECVMAPVESFSYDFEHRMAVFVMPEGCCTDMYGAITVAKRIDRHVRLILTVSGERMDTWYERDGAEWHARTPSQAAVERYRFLRPVPAPLKVQ